MQFSIVLLKCARPSLKKTSSGTKFLWNLSSFADVQAATFAIAPPAGF